MNRTAFLKTNETLKYSYRILPDFLYTHPVIVSRSSGAWRLYSYMLRRSHLSRLKNWADSQGRIYIYFTQNEVQKVLNIKSTSEAQKYLKELEDAGLIYRKRQGLGKPNRIYVRIPCDEEAGVRFILPGDVPEDAEILQECTDASSVGGEDAALPDPQDESCPYSEFQEVRPADARRESECNEDVNPVKSYDKTEEGTGHTPSHRVEMTDEEAYSACREKLVSKISYGSLKNRFGNSGLPDTVLSVLLDTLTTRREFIRVKSEQRPSSVVKSLFWRVSEESFCRVCEQLEKYGGNVRYMESYILTCLYDEIQTGKVRRIAFRGKTSSGRRKTRNRFNNFGQHDYDFAEIERRLLAEDDEPGMQGAG